MAKFYQVGGSVRDGLLEIKSKDIDYAVEASSFEAMRAAIVDRGGEIFLETPQYFTIRARVPGLGACDFVLCRKEGIYHDGRHPTSVTPGTIYDDLARRDFTVNAIARAENGDVIDPYDGVGHLIVDQMLKCVGSAKERFSEDGLRILRAIRFSLTKDLMMDDEIWSCLVDEDYCIDRLQGVSAERVREELHKCFAFNTNETLELFDHFLKLRKFLFKSMWLEPTFKGV
jgi:tRNA nucleotidyltransferase (CCA-adding enzyme)